jgi:hypothetical protein
MSHCTHRPSSKPPIPQTGVAPTQSAGVHARHVSSEAPLDLPQMGVDGVVLQSVSLAHATH